jgi:hypothetical protein
LERKIRLPFINGRADKALWCEELNGGKRSALQEPVGEVNSTSRGYTMRLLQFQIIGIISALALTYVPVLPKFKGSEANAQGVTALPPAQAAALQFGQAHPMNPLRVGWQCLDDRANVAARGPEFEPYNDFPVLRCNSSRTHPASGTRQKSTLIATVWILAPSETDLAAWVGKSCLRLKAKNQARCGAMMAEMVFKQNNGHFAVAGHILETQQEAGCDKCSQNLLIYMPFRHGVTVRMAREPKERRNVSFATYDQALAAANLTFGTVAIVGNYGRVSNVFRPTGLSDSAWLIRNRDSYLNALRTGNYPDLDRSFPAYCKKLDCGL